MRKIKNFQHALKKENNARGTKFFTLRVNWALKSKILSFGVNFQKIVTIFGKRLINKRLLSGYTVGYMLLSENMLHLWQTTILVNVNITITIKYALTRATETFTQKRRSSKAC